MGRRALVFLVTVACGNAPRSSPTASAPPGASSAPAPTLTPAVSPIGREGEPAPPPAVVRDPSGKVAVKQVSGSRLPARASDVVVDASHLYWATPGRGIARLAKTGGAAEVVTPLGEEESVTAIAATPTHVAWATNQAMHPGHGAVYVRESASGAVKTMMRDLAIPIAVTVDHAHVYVATMGGVAAAANGPESAAIRRARLTTGAVEVVQRGLDGATDLVIEGGHLYTHAAQSAASGSDVVRMPKAGGNVEVLATGQEGVRGLAVDEGFVYFAMTGPLEMPSPGSGCKKPPCPVATAAPRIVHGEIRRVAKSPGAAIPQTLARDLGSPRLLGVNAANVVFDHGDAVFLLGKTGEPKTMNRLASRSSASVEYVPHEDALYVIGESR